MSTVRADIHGAVSLVNAIAAKKGATLGIDLNVSVEVKRSSRRGITIQSDSHSLSSRLINRTVEKTVPKKELNKTGLEILLRSDIPAGYGLKSSSAISSAVSLACTKLFRGKIDDARVLLAGVDASIETRVSITGAYDDACACYYGGFAVTDNSKRRIIRAEKCPGNLSVAIFIPKSRRRGNVKKLYPLKPAFEAAWRLAKKSDYWNAMMLNGLATSSVLSSEPGIITDLIEHGALGASVSGNGPAVAAVAKRQNMSGIKKVFSALEGRVIIARINNKKAKAYEL